MRVRRAYVRRTLLIHRSVQKCFGHLEICAMAALEPRGQERREDDYGFF